MKKKYLLMVLAVFVMAITFSGCYYGRYHHEHYHSYHRGYHRY